MKAALLGCAAALLLAGCAALDTTGEVLDALFPTPQEQCQSEGGRYTVVTVYDEHGVAHQREECRR